MSWYGHLMLAQADEAPLGPSGPAGGEAGPTGTQSTTGQPTGGATTPQGPDYSTLYMVVLFIVVMWVLILLPQRREKKKHAEMLGALKKGDRVHTVGGVLGTVVDVRDHEVVLKVDEANNTRMRFTRAAIQGVIGEESKT